ncbi:MAG: hypothetical protein LAP87_16355 [Acidobacteriia bacterium]|nr:hypothetical protein [Terriglobia bacterium]
MVIHHRLHLDAEIADPILESFGLSFPANPNGRILIPDVSEDDPSWPRIAMFLNEYHCAWAAHPANASVVARYGSTKDSLADFALAKFSGAERKNAPFLALTASLRGFPQPQDVLEFYKMTYRTACPSCRSGSEQVLPIHLSAEPKWAASRGIFQLNWVEDELLVKKEMFDEVFRPFGIPSRPVLDYKSGAVFRDVVQLDISLKSDVDLSKATYDICQLCGARTYNRDGRDYAPLPLGSPGPIFKSNQWFNPFHSIVYVTQELCRSIGESGFRGAYSIPCPAQPVA